MDLTSMLNPGLAPESIANLNPMLRTALQNMVATAPPGIRSGLRINSGYRSEERQRQLYEAALKKYGNEQAARKWVAPPGRSQHNFGKAVDLGYLSPRAKAWVHENAGKFGLHFPMSHEPWHIEMVGGREGKPVMVASTGGPPVAGNTSPGLPISEQNREFDLRDVLGGLGPVGLGVSSMGMSSAQGPKVIRGQLDPTIYQNV